MPPQYPATTQPRFVEKPTEVEEKQQELEADLQFLLDAQAEGLIQGLEGGNVDDRSSTGSTTPTVHGTRSPVPRRMRPPRRRQPGLRSARKGIYSSIIALANLKNGELQNVHAEVHEHDATLGQIEAWEKKRQGLHEASRNVDSEEETIRVQRLKQEADALQVEINRVELSLTEMKTRHRKLVSQAAAMENSVQARIASYTESLRLLENDIQKFLRRSPDGLHARPLAASSAEVKASVWQLPPQRRNLDLAKAYWNEQREQALQHAEDTKFEKSALIEGAGMWREAVTEVTDFEKQLRTEMSALRPSSPNSQSAWDDPPSTSISDNEHADRMQHILEKIDNVAESLHAKLQKAEERNWKLLQAALGAELDALSRGKQILASALSAAGSKSPETGGHELKKANSSEEIDALDKSFSASRAVNDDDEEPPPELLFSKAHDVDTE